MTETFAALLLAHVLADFVLQNRAMAEAKRQPAPLALHGVIVLATACVTLGGFHPALIALSLAHVFIDFAKSFTPSRRLWPFLADQGAHLVTLLALAALLPGLWAEGIWATGLAGIAPDPLWPTPSWLPGLMAVAAGLVLCTRAGGFAVAILLSPWSDAGLPDGLSNAGRLIGNLERGLIFLLVLAGQPGGIGFLIAAKSILRFETARENQRAGEYVIVGTLASFAWALAVSYATLALLRHLPAIGILPAGP